ncbi:group III truncated hemoglobin [Cohaesibacter sp. CAU 1516]|uniref:group III truncated hemoglobin n=1 Tax=Cohaesibacter sp. CAU 1516 TaxID=2576038 RepID=UPI0010FE71D2|nr:group III truncated hemoglobin [Cohaesibacter sp. CAU 1516]TLP45612.1 group III truncated hemoglobin [Cohaesibacter sp. CAU 1516]
MQQEDDNDLGKAPHTATSEELVGRPLVRKQRTGKPLHASITEQQVSDLVDTFYGKVRQHPRLAMLFAGGLSMEWPEHLDRMKAFWRSMLMQTREYGGKPVPAHLKLEGLDPEDFADWLTLFRQTARDLCPEAAADLYISRAETIAKTLQMAVFMQGRIAPPDAFDHGVMSKDFLAFVRRKDQQDES